MSLLSQMLEAQRRFQLQLLAKANVVGVGLGYKDDAAREAGRISLIAMVERKLPAEALSQDDLIPQELDGATTDVIEVGRLEAQVNDSPTDIWRPTIPPGVSIGHFLITAGTFGALVYDRQTGEPLILSNNHVLANSNGASLLDPVLQPGPTDGGTRPAQTVAELYRYLPFAFSDERGTRDIVEVLPDGGTNEPTDPTDPQPPVTPPPSNEGCANLVIALGNAIARLNDPDAEVIVTSRKQSQTMQAQTATLGGVVDPLNATTLEAQQLIPENPMDAALARPIASDDYTFSDEILNIGRITGTKNASLGSFVRKMGRTTGYTEGRVTVVNSTVDIWYNTPTGRRSARFTGQVMTTGMSQGGDSGSLVVDKNSQNAVGLLFAGSGTTTVFTPIDEVLDRLRVQMTPPAMG